MKDKKRMVISIDAAKPLEKIQHPLRIKPLSKVGVEGTYLEIVKSRYDTPTAGITLSGEKLEAFL